MELSKKNVILIFCHLSAKDKIYNFFNDLAKYLAKNNNELIISTSFTKQDFEKHYKKLYFKHIHIKGHLYEFSQSNFDINPKKLESILSNNQSTNIEKFNIFCDQNWTIKRPNDFTKTYTGMKFFEKKIDALLGYLKPTIVMAWSPGTLPSSTLIYQISKKNRIPTFSIEKGWLPDTLMVDPIGLTVDSLLKNSYAIQKSIKKHNDINRFKDYKKWYLEKKIKCNEQAIKKISFLNSKDVEILKPAITILGQFDIFTSKKTLNLGAELSSNFNSSMHIVEIIEKKFFNEKINIYFKPHPFDAYKIKKISNDRKIKIITNESDVSSIIQNSDVLIMGDSKLTYEAMLQNKKIINFSNSFLNDLNLTHNVNDISQLESKIRELLKSKKNTKSHNVAFFFDWMLNFYLTHLNSKLNFGFSLKDFSQDLLRFGSRNFSGDVDEKKLQKIVDGTFNKKQIEEIIPEIYLKASKDELNSVRDELKAIQNERSYKFLVKLKNNVFLMRFYKLYIYFTNKYKKIK